MARYLDRFDDTRVVVPVVSTSEQTRLVRCRVYWRKRKGDDFEPISTTLERGFGGFVSLPIGLFDQPHGFVMMA